MGEKIKDIGKLNIKEMGFDVEINEPVDKERGAMVHIQNDGFRIEMSQRDFYDMAAAVMLAKRQLERIKNIGANNKD